MNRIKKLTPAVLKNIIKEERQKLANERRAKRGFRNTAGSETAEINDIAKKTIKEARLLLKLKRLQEKTKLLKKGLVKNK